MQDTAKVSRKRDGDGAGRRPLVDEQLANQLTCIFAGHWACMVVTAAVPPCAR